MLSDPGCLQGGFGVPQVFMVISTIVIFELILEWNILIGFFHIGITYDVGKRARRHILIGYYVQLE